MKQFSEILVDIFVELLTITDYYNYHKIDRKNILFYEKKHWLPTSKLPTSNSQTRPPNLRLSYEFQYQLL